jgi:nucleoside-diphosphate-sugar epimerase
MLHQMKLLITGAAGYVGSALIDALVQVAWIDRIVCIDLRPQPETIKACSKIQWIQADLSTDGWQSKVRATQIDAVVHLAFQIRQLYGKAITTQERWNIGGARKVFEFALNEPSVHRLVHFSTVTSYGANPKNSLMRRFTEASALREDSYLYGVHKKQVESLLRQLYAATDKSKHVVVLRCASITGPLGRFKHRRYGLVSTLTRGFPIFPCGRSDFGRQYLHEDDITNIVSMLLFKEPKAGLEILNAAPNDYLTTADLAKLLDLRPVVVPPFFLRVLFWLIWQGSQGKIATAPGAWKTLSYPVAVDPSRLAREYGYKCRYSSVDALTARRGRHAPAYTEAKELTEVAVQAP